MGVIVLLFWISLVVLFYSYLGYGILVFLINSFRKIFPRRKHSPIENLPVTLIIPAYNESNVLREKIQNSLSLDYPDDLLRIIIVTDGSDDGSQELAKQHSRIILLHQPERKGKFAAIQRAMRIVTTPVVVFSDANSMLNRESILRLVSHYADPEVGGVAGEKKVSGEGHDSAVGEAEGLYWKYESILKKLDASFYTVVGAAGELFSIRSALFREEKENLILDDFVISMNVCLQGYKIAYEKNAFATELPSASLEEEEKRKLRIAAGAYQALALLKESLNIFRHPRLSFQFFSRRVLRWLVCPLMLVILFISNLLLANRNPAFDFYDLAFYGQLIFYVAAFSGWWLIAREKKLGLMAIPFYFLFMNYCLVKGFIRFLRGKQQAAWERSLRMDKIKG